MQFLCTRGSVTLWWNQIIFVMEMSRLIFQNFCAKNSINTDYKHFSSIRKEWVFYYINSNGYKLLKMFKSSSSKSLVHFILAVMLVWYSVLHTTAHGSTLIVWSQAMIQHTVTVIKVFIVSMILYEDDLHVYNFAILCSDLDRQVPWLVYQMILMKLIMSKFCML